VLSVLRVQTHDWFLKEMWYDDRCNPLLQRAGLDVVSFQVRRGLPTFNLAVLTTMVDRWRFRVLICILFASFSYL
jgi:hypothetical protein